MKKEFTTSICEEYSDAFMNVKDYRLKLSRLNGIKRDLSEKRFNLLSKDSTVPLRTE
jgi:hypothetical protein